MGDCAVALAAIEAAQAVGAIFNHNQIVLAGNIPGITQTIPLAIYEYTSMPGGDSMALSLCLISILLSFAVLLIGEAANRTLARS